MCTCIHTNRNLCWCFTGSCQRPMKGFRDYFFLLAALLCWLLRSDLLRPSMKQQSVTVAASSKDHYLLFTFKNFVKSSKILLLWSYKFFTVFVVCCAWSQTEPLQLLVRSYAIQVWPLSPFLLGFVGIGSYVGFPQCQDP